MADANADIGSGRCISEAPERRSAGLNPAQAPYREPPRSGGAPASAARDPSSGAQTEPMSENVLTELADDLEGLISEYTKLKAVGLKGRDWDDVTNCEEQVR